MKRRIALWCATSLAVIGCIVPAGDVPTLAAVLQECVAGGKIGEDRRRSVHATAMRHGVGELVDVFLRRIDSVV